MAPTSQRRGDELEKLIPKHITDRFTRKCTRVQCGSEDVYMRYFNNNDLNQPRFACNTCKKNFTLGGKTRQPYRTKKNIVMKRPNLGISKLEARCMKTTGSKSIGGATFSKPRIQQIRRVSKRVHSSIVEGALDKNNSIDMENEEKISQDASIQALAEETNLVEGDEGHFEGDEVDELEEEDGDYFPEDEIDEPVGEDDDHYVLEDEVGEHVEEDNDRYVLEDEVEELVEDDDDRYVLKDVVDEHFEEGNDYYVLKYEGDNHVEEDDDGYVIEDEVDEPVDEGDDSCVLKYEVDDYVEEDDDHHVVENEVDEPIEEGDDCYVLKYESDDHVEEDDDNYIIEDEVDEPLEEDGDDYVQEDEVDEPIEEDKELEMNDSANVSEVKIQAYALQTKAIEKSSTVISTNKLTRDTVSKRKEVMKRATRYLIDALTTLEEVYLEKHAMMLNRKYYEVEQARERENKERSKYEETLHSLRNWSMQIVGSWAQYESLTTTRLDKMVAREDELKMVSQEVEELYSQAKQIDIIYACHYEVVKIERKANQLWNRVVELVQ